MEAQQAGWRPLGEVIAELGLISQEDLEDALLEQRITHKRLGTILIEKGILTAQQLTDALVDQIGVDELLEELDYPEEGGDENGERTPRAFGIPFRRVRDRLGDIDLPRPRRPSNPFPRAGHRRSDLPVAPFAPVLPPEPEDFDEPEESAAVLELVEPESVAVPEPEPVVEAPDDVVHEELEDEPDGPHAWLDDIRLALEDAEADLRRLDNFAIMRSVEAEEARSRLADHEAALAATTAAHSHAEEEIRRLHALLDERDAGLTAMESTVEELRRTEATTKAKLDAARTELDRQSARIKELEAQVTELAENLSATDETLGIETNAREQAQRETKRLHQELDTRDASIAKLAGRIEALEGELEVVAEREQSQRTLRSRTEPAPEPEAAPKARAKPERRAAGGRQSEGFLYFVPRAGEGYELLEQPGSAPAVGDTIELEGKRYEVTRHSRSPLPFDRRACVYLRAG